MLNIQVGITDHLDPEVQAMVLAMYSRSYGPVAERIPDSAESAEEHKKKLGRFYVNYGHKSVGQLGSTTVWLEGISQLAAKAIENHPLFNGQESSTRYIDYSDQPMINNDEGVAYWQEKFRAFYVKVMPLVVEKIKEEFPYDVQYPGDATEEQHNKNTTTWNNTVKARAFDICRGILPAGCTTNAGFVGTFDTLNDHFGEMLHHPCEEMRGIAFEVLCKMKDKYPYGTMEVEKLRERFSYVKQSHFYQGQSNLSSDELFFLDSEHSFMSEETIAFMGVREKFQKVDRVTSSKVRMIYRNLLDFGSYRDLHRHRPGVIDMCVLDPTYGFHKFYINNLPESSQVELDELLKEFLAWYNDESNMVAYVDKQYAVPMGFVIPVSYSCDLNQAMYMMELRTGKTVHQTLRMFMQDWVYRFKGKVGDQVKIHADMDDDNFTLKRGTQTFDQDIYGNPPPVYELFEKEQVSTKPLVEMSLIDVLKFKTLMDQVVSSFGPTEIGSLRLNINYSAKADELISLLNQKDIKTTIEELDEKHEIFKSILIPESDIDKFLYIYQLVSNQEKQSVQGA